VPSGFTARGLPFGVTFIGPPGSDAALATLGARWQGARGLALGHRLRAATVADRVLQSLPAATPTLQIAVLGAHLEGMPLHGQLVERGCHLVERTRTAPRYRLYALAGTEPAKPGISRVTDGEPGHAIEVEVYDMPMAEVGSFLALIAPPLALGSLQLASGRWVHGFVCEGAALAGATDISAYGGWRAYQKAGCPPEPSKNSPMERNPRDER
jgi:allophanate hydrolase